MRPKLKTKYKRISTLFYRGEDYTNAFAVHSPWKDVVPGNQIVWTPIDSPRSQGSKRHRLADIDMYGTKIVIEDSPGS